MDTCFSRLKSDDNVTPRLFVMEEYSTNSPSSTRKKELYRGRPMGRDDKSPPQQVINSVALCRMRVKRRCCKQTSDGCIMRRGTTSSCQSAAISKIVKHCAPVSSAVASTQGSQTVGWSNSNRHSDHLKRVKTVWRGVYTWGLTALSAPQNRIAGGDPKPYLSLSTVMSPTPSPRPRSKNNPIPIFYVSIQLHVHDCED